MRFSGTDDPLMDDVQGLISDEIKQERRLRRRGSKNPSEIATPVYTENTLAMVSGYFAAREMRNEPAPLSGLFENAVRQYGEVLGQEIQKNLLGEEKAEEVKFQSGLSSNPRNVRKAGWIRSGGDSSF